jgi:hypothetical protein
LKDKKSADEKLKETTEMFEAEKKRLEELQKADKIKIAQLKKD